MSPFKGYRGESLMRDPAALMRPERLSVIQPSRVSASRALIARASRERWDIRCVRFDIDARSRGIALYSIAAGGWKFSFPVYSFEPKLDGRSGRIIGRAWDMMAALVEGDVSQDDVEHIGRELPKLYEGRALPRTLTWARSNRSGRLFDNAMRRLAAGQQPDLDELARTCYFMRNTGIDGNGTFGTRSFLALEADHPLRSSLMAQMLTAYMMRVFAIDLAHHLAALNGGVAATRLRPDFARFLGVGNGSALGLMFFVNNHPKLIDRWLRIREEAIAEARLLRVGRDAAPLRRLKVLLDRAVLWRNQDRLEYEILVSSATVAEDLRIASNELAATIERAEQGLEDDQPLLGWIASLDGRLHPEAFETVLSLLIELVPETADRLVSTLVVDEDLVGRPEMSAARLREIIDIEYRWVFDLDLTSERANHYLWYKSRTAEEPRRGPRSEVVDAYSLGLDLPRLVAALSSDLAGVPARMSVAEFLLGHPWHRQVATRIQALAGLPYHSPHADIMSLDFVPAYITRLINVGIHGIDKTRDFLDRNLRGVLFHGAPLPEDLASGNAEPHWFNPPEPRQ